ncbi:MAG: bifunctional UDP-N-acetylglucosamine diphosphorylase/glucosamine-1-phosphate N-acetyltransferase GlmU [Chloroflexi bacterium]|nr:MAG: bifunctional UDP-N-acetylglucosamine diphosphorylase/glucosamine-1-phosphate N-acetyltransferase GlmU [Chloroflexota bacterium]
MATQPALGAGTPGMGGGEPPLAPTGLGETDAAGGTSPFPEGDVDTATGDPAHALATRSTAANWHNRLDLSPTLTAVILAAGHGTRMRSRIPKVLHPICGRPMIDWVLEAVNEAGVKDVTVIANPHHADVAAHLSPSPHRGHLSPSPHRGAINRRGKRVLNGLVPQGRGEGRGPVKVAYQRDPRGTAHALQQIPAGELRGRQVLVVNGDSPLLTAASILKVLHAHQENSAPATIASVEDPTRDDGRIVRSRDGALDRIVERKDATPEQRNEIHEFNVGVYCFDGSRLVEELEKIKDDNKAGEFYLTDVFLHLKPVTVVMLDDPDEAMGIKDRVRLARATGILRRRVLEQCMLGGVTIVDPDSTFVDVGVTIGVDTVIEPFTVLKGDTHIGSECRIGPHVYIEDAKIGDRSDCGPFAKLRPGTEIAEDVHIGSFTELVRTKVGRGSAVPHVSYLGDTDLGMDANIGAGTITANFDGTNKNRTEIGDGAFIGVDTMLVVRGDQGRSRRRDSRGSSS